MSKKVSDILPQTEILAQLAEEASELAQAALKLRRALDGTNPTPKDIEECRYNILEEFADVLNCINAYCCDDDFVFHNFTTRAIKIRHKKLDRWLSRLEEKENKNGLISCWMRAIRNHLCRNDDEATERWIATMEKQV